MSRQFGPCPTSATVCLFSISVKPSSLEIMTNRVFEWIRRFRRKEGYKRRLNSLCSRAKLMLDARVANYVDFTELGVAVRSRTAVINCVLSSLVVTRKDLSFSMEMCDLIKSDLTRANVIYDLNGTLYVERALALLHALCIFIEFELVQKRRVVLNQYTRPLWNEVLRSGLWLEWLPCVQEHEKLDILASVSRTIYSECVLKRNLNIGDCMRKCLPMESQCLSIFLRQ